MPLVILAVVLIDRDTKLVAANACEARSVDELIYRDQPMDRPEEIRPVVITPVSFAWL